MTDDELPIERGFPIERVNELAEKESRAKMHYRPVYTMHKWWARRLGSVFRTICLYTLLDDPEQVTVREPGTNAETLGDAPQYDVGQMLADVSLENPEALWELYPKDVRVENKKILDPFMGGGTSLVEASRFGVDSVGYDLNPVAWFVTKKQLEAGQTDVEELEAAFEQVRADVADEITRYYRTPCPNAEEVGPADPDDPLALGDDVEYELPPDLRDGLSEYDHYADVMYNFWVKELDCVECGATVPLFKDYRVGKARFGDEGYNVFCPGCESVVLVDDWRSECACPECDYDWVPEEGTVSGSEYACPECGKPHSITERIQERGGFDTRHYSLEYYCPICDERGRSRGEVKGYKSSETFDIALNSAAREEWSSNEELHEYVPDERIYEGAITKSSELSGNDLFQHGYESWKDLFNTRQLLSLSKIVKSISQIESPSIREFLLLALSDSVRYNSLLVTYNRSYNKADHSFKQNSFVPTTSPVENNVWGTKYGSGTFQAIWEMVVSGVKYASSPTERYVDDGENLETEGFHLGVGQNSEVSQSDARRLSVKNEYDAVITDPPYYDNIIYSEVSDFFYVWQKILLEDEYDCFGYDKTPRADSIVTNPYLDKTDEDFESELHEAFTVVHRALKENGVLAFTYHHAGSESWGELLAALCDVGFEVTATYPISADVNKFISGEAVEFDILIVARPSDDREPIGWPDLRKRIFRTARETRQRLETNRDLSRGDIGVIEMGECFHEYSKHHENVRRDGEVMTAKEVVEEIYGIIQEASDIGTTEVFLDLLEEPDPDFDTVNKLCRGANTTPDELKEQALFTTADGFTLGTWDNEDRIAYLEDAVRDGELDDLGRLQFLRYRFDRDDPIARFVGRWIDADLRKLAAKLSDRADDPVYEKVLEMRETTDPTDGDRDGQTGLNEYL